jgi:hypothetical protein
MPVEAKPPHEQAPDLGIEQIKIHIDRLGLCTANAAAIRQLSDFGGGHFPVAGLPPRPSAIVKNRMDLGTSRYVQGDQLDSASVRQHARNQMWPNAFHGGQQMRNQLAHQLVHRLGVLRDAHTARQTARLGDVLQPQHQPAA